MPEPRSTSSRPPYARLHRITVAFAAALVVCFAVIGALPDIARWQISESLEDLGVRSTEIEGIRINPVTGRMEIRQFRATGPDGTEISIGSAKLNISLSALARRQVTIQDLTVSEANVSLRRDEQGRWWIGGIQMGFGSGDGADASESENEPWDVKANEILLANSDVAVTVGPDTFKAKIARLQVEALSTLRPDEPATLRLEASAAGGTIRAEGRLYPFRPDPGGAVALSASGIDLSIYEPLLASGRIKHVAGKTRIVGDVRLAISDGDGIASFDGSIGLAGFDLSTTLFRARSDELSWKGSATIRRSLALEAAAVLPAVKASGVAAASRFGFTNLASDTRVSSASATFATDESGIVFSPSRDGKSGGITGMLNASLSKSELMQPDSGITVSGQELRASARLRLSLPPNTADLSGDVSGEASVTKLDGSIRQAGVERFGAESLKLAYRELQLALTGDGSISAKTRADVDAGSFDFSLPASGVKGSAASFSGKNNEVRFNRTADGSLTFAVAGPLALADARAQSPDGAWVARNETVAWSGTARLDGNADTGAAWKVDGTLDGKRADISMPSRALEVAMGSLSWTGSAGSKSAETGIRADGAFRLAGTTVRLGDRDGAVVAAMQDLRAEKISLAGQDAAIARLSMTGLSVEPAAAAQDGFRAALGSIDATNVALRDGLGVSVGNIRGDGAVVRLVRDAAGDLVLPATETGEGRTESSGASEKDRAAQASPGRIRIERVSLPDAKIVFVDNSTKPALELETTALNMEVTGIDTGRPDSDAGIDLSVDLGSFGRITGRGTFKPDIEKVSAKVALSFDSIELFKFNPYLEPALKRAVKQGRADAKIDLTIDANALDAKSAIVISKMQLQDPSGAASPKEGDRRKTKESAPPIETGLSLLQDDKGIIKLSIPVRGSLTDPKFDLSDAIGQAVGNVLKDTLFTAVKIAFPLGAVFAVVDAVGNSKIAIKPLAFDPGSAALTPELTDRIAEIGTYLRKDADETPSVCGTATAADVAFFAAKDKATADAKAVELAQHRTEAVIARLTQVYGIAPARLFACSPEIDTADGAMPRVDVKI
jgi:uncharacterized protein involved in outer membrane biogenesis